MEKSSVWSKVGSWFRGDEPADVVAMRSTESPLAVTVADKSPDKSPGESAPAPPVPAQVPLGSVPPPRTNGPLDPSDSKRNDDRANDDRTAELVASIKEHLEAQVQGADVLVGALDRLADGLELLPGAAKNELDVLERIGGDVAGAVGTLKRLETTLGQVPKIADGQREAIVALTHELSCARETDTKIAGVLGDVQQVMVELRDGVGRSAGAMREFRTEMVERHEGLSQLVERQAQRFVWLAVAAVALGGVAAILGVISLIK